MASAQTTEIFNCPVEQFFAIVSDYESYSEFLSEVNTAKIIENNGSEKLVEFNISVVKSFTYRLRLTEDKPYRISWVFDSGDLFKTSNGSWDLEDDNGRTKATYAIDASFKMFVPGPVAKTLVNVNLPQMMSSYHKRVRELYGEQ